VRSFVSLLLTERAEKEIAQELGLTLATAHTYVTDSASAAGRG
jgi:predicted transcriptional regulator